MGKRMVLAATTVALVWCRASMAANSAVPVLRAVTYVKSTGVTEAAASVLHVEMSRLLVPALLEVPGEESVLVSDWPLTTGTLGTVRLTRHDVYGPGATIYRVDGAELSEVPRSKLVFLWGETEEGDHDRVLLSVDPDAGTLHGYVEAEEGWVETRPVADVEDEYVVASTRTFLGASADELHTQCGQEDLPALPGGSERVAPPPTEAISTLHRITLGVDTDNELLQLKFADNTTTATNYIASLFGLMSVIYERDLLVRLVQGTTFLRVSTTPDPYSATGTGNADSAKLNEFRNYWMANYASVARGAAMLLSGKQGSATSASGIGFVNALCRNDLGYTFSQVFKFNGSTASSDMLLVAHEIGHNFGSLHTHCYSPPIDTCWNLEGGCYSGATSCPAPQTMSGIANVRGSIMSYCHQLSGCSASAVFHPQSILILNPIVASKVGVCIFPAISAVPKEVSPADNMTARRGSGASVVVNYTPACGATNHTVYAGNLATLGSGGISWTQRACSLGTSGSLTFTPASSSSYFVVVGNDGTKEGSYGQRSSGERPAAGPGGSCTYVQELSGTCP